MKQMFGTRNGTGIGISFFKLKYINGEGTITGSSFSFDIHFRYSNNKERYFLGQYLNYIARSTISFNTPRQSRSR
jgi:hypothetical protein